MLFELGNAPYAVLAAVESAPLGPALEESLSGTLAAAGDPSARTPHLDQLTAEGVRFTRSFATTAASAPSRASFLTGQYARRHGVADRATPLPSQPPTFERMR